MKHTAVLDEESMFFVGEYAFSVVKCTSFVVEHVLQYSAAWYPFYVYFCMLKNKNRKFFELFISFYYFCARIMYIRE